jgi:cyclopropane fatty-acyl-phospholipid synthase-like methyltransferase
LADNIGSRDLAAKLTLPQFPRSAAYDPQWMLRNLMGPNAVWLTEALSQAMDLRPGMRVLDMGCGRAISSIFLAREFGLQVWAADLWIKPTDNWQRIQEAGLADRVFPISAEAHALPFAEGFFDAIVSVDAYHYFGTDDLYLRRFARLVKSGG